LTLRLPAEVEYLRVHLSEKVGCNHVAAVLIAAYTSWVLADLYLNKLPAGTDWLTFISDPALRARTGSYFGIWKRIGWGEVSFVTVRNILSVASVLVPSSKAAVGVVHISLFSGAYALYRLLTGFIGSRLSLVGCLVFLSNQYVATQIASGHVHQIIGYSMTPVLLVLIEKYLAEGWKIETVSATAILTAVFSTLRIDPAAYAGFTAAFYLMLRLPGRYSSRPAHQFFSRLKFGASVVVLAAGLTAYQWLPVLAGAVPDYASLVFSRQTLVQYSLGFRKSLMGFGREYAYLFWNHGLSSTSHPLNFFEPFYIYAMSIPPIVVLAGALTSIRRKGIWIGLGASSVLAAFLAKGVYPPFPEIFYYLRDVVPLLSSMRVTNRWISAVWIAYAVLIPLGIDGLSRSLRKRERSVELVLSALVVLSIILSSFPVSVVGYQGWNPDSGLENAYSSLEGVDGKLVTVPYDSTRIKTDSRGVEKDLGAKSNVFHGMPVSNSEVRNTLASGFNSWSAEIMAQNRSSHLAGLLGRLTVSRLVVNNHPVSHVDHYGVNESWSVEQPYYQHRFWRSQKGVSLTGNYSGNEVYSVEERMPRIYEPDASVFVLGSRDVMLDIVKSYPNDSVVPVYGSQAQTKSEFEFLLNETDAAASYGDTSSRLVRLHSSFEPGPRVRAGPGSRRVDSKRFNSVSDDLVEIDPGAEVSVISDEGNVSLRFLSDSGSRVLSGKKSSRVEGISWFNLGEVSGRATVTNQGSNPVYVDVAAAVTRSQKQEFAAKAETYGWDAVDLADINQSLRLPDTGDSSWMVFGSTFDEAWRVEGAEHYRAFGLLNIFHTDRRDIDPVLRYQRYRSAGVVISSALVLILVLHALKSRYGLPKLSSRGYRFYERL
jgi:hypothetical protein